MSPVANSVAAHYSHQDLEAALLDALVASGKDPDRLTAEDLAPIDEFHVRGRKATHELASRLQLDGSLRVLDVGSGLGGPSRYLAQAFGCRVTGLDLTHAYCRAAAMLARRLGLAGRVDYLNGDALALPFAEGSFDVVWTQHALMNIPDKAGLCRELWRVLKPGGVLAGYDVFAGTGGPVHFPVPWAREPSISFLVTPGQMRATCEAAGFEVLHWCDTTEVGRSWFRHMGAKIRQEGPPPLGLHLVLGPDFRAMALNQVRNLEEDRIALVESVLRRPTEGGAP